MTVNCRTQTVVTVGASGRELEAIAHQERSSRDGLSLGNTDHFGADIYADAPSERRNNFRQNQSGGATCIDDAMGCTELPPRFTLGVAKCTSPRLGFLGCSTGGEVRAVVKFADFVSAIAGGFVTLFGGTASAFAG